MLRNPDPEKYICDKLVDMMEDKPFYEIKVKGLCNFAGISRSSFYNYFDSIYDALQKIEDDFFAGLLKEERWTRSIMSEYSKNDYAESMMMATAEYLHSNLRLFSILGGKNGDPSFHSRMANRIRRITEQFYDDSQMDLNYEQKKMLMEYEVGGQIAAIQWMASHGKDISALDIYNFCVWVIRRGIDGSDCGWKR